MEYIPPYVNQTVLGNFCIPDVVNTTNVQHPQMPDISVLKYYVDGLLSLIITILGFIGNILTIVVLTRRMMHSSTNCYLTALAIWDSLVLIITMFLLTLPAMSETFSRHYMPYVVVYIYPLGLIAQTTTIWLTLSFTVERYIAVCHPLKAARMCTIERARHVIVAVCIASFFYNIVRWFEYEIVYTCNAKSGLMTDVAVNITEFALNKIYQNIYFATLYPLIMSLVPLISLAILNTFLIMAVRRSSKQRHDMNVRQSRENNVTIMLVSVVIVFITCQIPAMVYNIAQASNPQLERQYGWAALSIIRNFLVNLNSAVNFLLYCTLGQKFRRTFMRTFCQCCLSDEEFNSITMQINAGMNPSAAMHASVRQKVRRKKRRGLFGCNTYDTSSSILSTRSSLISRNSKRSNEPPTVTASRQKQAANGELSTGNKNTPSNITPQKQKHNSGSALLTDHYSVANQISDDKNKSQSCDTLLKKTPTDFGKHKLSCDI